jgi:hypothetical protein
MQNVIRLGLVMGLLAVSGCGVSNRSLGEPVDVVLKVTAGGKPVNNVTLTLQPMVDGVQAQGVVTNGELKAMIVPGVYTYYIDSARNPADLAKIPEAYRSGSIDRQLEIKQSGTFEVQIN